MYESVFQKIINQLLKIQENSNDDQKDKISDLIEEIKKNQAIENRNKNFFDEIFDLVNCSGNDRRIAEYFEKNIYKIHRTLQQSFFRLIHRIIEDYAKLEFNRDTDARNEKSLEWAKKVANSEEVLKYAKEVAKINGFFPLI